MEVSFENGCLSVVGQDLKEIPAELGEKYGDKTSTLTLSHNLITTVTNLEKFTYLKSLILDNNMLISQQDFPVIESLETLWVNNNKIDSLELFLNNISGKFPNLTYLSMFKNACCPNYFVGKDSGAYQGYRYYVLSRVTKLKFLDSSLVNDNERVEAVKLHNLIARPDPEQYKRKGSPKSPLDDSRGRKQDEQLYKSLPQEDNLGNHKASFGVTRYIYYGRQSEGNRFIVDDAL